MIFDIHFVRNALNLQFWNKQDRFFQESWNMIRTPAQHQTDQAKLPGQRVNPIPASMLSQPQSAAYKPTHGGFPDANPR